MTKRGLSPAANERLDEIYNYTRRQWGEDQAASYTRSLFECFDRITESRAVSRMIPAMSGAGGYLSKAPLNRYLAEGVHVVEPTSFASFITSMVLRSLASVQRFGEWQGEAGSTGASHRAI